LTLQVDPQRPITLSIDASPAQPFPTQINRIPVQRFPKRRAVSGETFQSEGLGRFRQASTSARRSLMIAEAYCCFFVEIPSSDFNSRDV
jgi:hypothetical protein